MAPFYGLRGLQLHRAIAGIAGTGFLLFGYVAIGLLLSVVSELIKYILCNQRYDQGALGSDPRVVARSRTLIDLLDLRRRHGRATHATFLR